MTSLNFLLIQLVFVSIAKGIHLPSLYSTNVSSPTIPNNNCPPMKPILNANIEIKTLHKGLIAAIITCRENYNLVGTSIIYCDNNIWSFGFADTPKCEKRCPPPPYLEHGKLELEKKIEDLFSPTGSYLQGTVAKYTCIEGYILEPPSSSARICENGYWTGSDVFCKPSMEMTCLPPPIIENGYMQPSFTIGDSLIAEGQEVVYQCALGYKLIGSDRIKCTDQGVWVPKAPSCYKTDLFPKMSCDSIPYLDPKAHARIEIGSISSTMVEVGCQANYQNSLAPCQASKFYCKNGKWVGVYPQCVDAHMCSQPPAVSYAIVINRNFETSYDSSGLPIFPVNAQITFECLKGYILDGSPVISCKPNGCWEASGLWPTCIRTKENYFIELNNINAILISSATGAAVLGILLMACLVVACKKRKALARAVSLPTTTNPITRHSPDVGNDHAILLQHPDRLALIAFADGVQNSQNNSLPSYDEATRDRSTLIQVSRLQIQRPHWPNLAICRSSGRSRGSPNIDSGHHVARHGSSASHTPSMRSGGESMGSTDTVTISEGSTNVTLDTASSHSAVSQNPSCRGHCGSLASFDACSMINTEGVPLLEESELEEIQGGNNDIDNPIVSDNTSSKISTHSAPVMTN